MAKFAISLKVVNSGSPNDYPCAGAASECYLAIGSISPSTPDSAIVTTLFKKEICNGGNYRDFLDQKTEKTVDTIEIDDSPSSALVITFSVYWGNRVADKVIKLVAEKATGVAFGKIYADIAAGMMGDLLKDKLKAFEKKLVSSIMKDTDSFVDTIGVELVNDFGSLVQENSFTLKILSGVDRQETFLGVPVISAGDLVAEITFTKVA